VTGEEEPLVNTGRTAFRCLIPFDDIMASPELRSLFENQPPGFWVPFDLATNTFVVTYPCRGNKMLNVALMCPTEDGRKDADDWHSPASVETMLERIKNAHPNVKLLLGKAPEVKCYNINVRGPLSTLFRGRVVITGDAAHPVTPTHAQGGVIAQEEAAALEVFFRDIQSGEQVESRLRQYDELLRPHCALVQFASNSGHVDHDALSEERLRKHYSGPLPGGGMPFSKKFRDFFYGYNILEEAENYIKE
jgi:salicylate hydroxylase